MADHKVMRVEHDCGCVENIRVTVQLVSGGRCDDHSPRYSGAMIACANAAVAWLESEECPADKVYDAFATATRHYRDMRMRTHSAGEGE